MKAPTPHRIDHTPALITFIAEARQVLTTDTGDEAVYKLCSAINTHIIPLSTDLGEGLDLSWYLEPYDDEIDYDSEARVAQAVDSTREDETDALVEGMGALTLNKGKGA